MILCNDSELFCDETESILENSGYRCSYIVNLCGK